MIVAMIQHGKWYERWFSHNFYLTTLRFPVEGYKPLQDPPITAVAKATELISCLERLLPAVSCVKSCFTVPCVMYFRHFI